MEAPGDPIILEGDGKFKRDLDELAEGGIKDWPRPNSPAEFTSPRRMVD